MNPSSPQHPRGSTVRVFVSPENWATGFFYRPNFICTAAHLFVNRRLGQRVRVLCANGTDTHGYLRELHPPNATSASATAFPDVAIVETPEVAGRPMQLYRGSYLSSSTGVGYWGYPRSSPDGIYTTVMISGSRAIPNQAGPEWYRINGEVEAGASGAPLVLDNGEVVGVVISAIDGRDRGSATPIHLLLAEVPDLKEAAALPIALDTAAARMGDASPAMATLPVSSDPIADAFLSLLRDQANSGQVADSLRRLTAVIEQPGFADREDASRAAYLRLAAGLTLVHSGDADAAQALVDRARPVPNSAVAVLDAKIALARGDSDRALGFIAEQFDANADQTRVATFYFTDRNQALTAVTEARERHPGDGELMRLEALIVLGLKRQADAVELARRALAASPASALAHWTLGVALYHARVPRELIPAVVEGPPNPITPDMLIVNQETDEAITEAIEHLRAANPAGGLAGDPQAALQVWELAALLLAGRLEEAATIARAALVGPAYNSWVVPWIVRWNVHVDMDGWSTATRERIDDGTARVADAQVYADMDIVRGDGREAETVLRAAHDLFAQAGSESAWRITLARALARQERYGDAVDVLGDADERLAAPLRDAVARRSGQEQRESALAAYKESGDALQLLAAVDASLAANDAQWAAPLVDELVENLQTRAAAESALTVLYAVRDISNWERLFAERRLVLDEDQPRIAQMRIDILVQTGLLPEAAAIARRQVELLPAADAYFRWAYVLVQMADVETLAIAGREFLRSGKQDPQVALQLAEWLVSSNRRLAADLFDRAMESEIPLGAVQLALLVAHAVGRDDRTEPLVRRLPELVAAGTVRTGGLVELREIMGQRVDAVRSLNASYRDGAIPIHGLADDQNFPIIQTHVMIARTNATGAPATWTPVYVRHAARGPVDGTPLLVVDTLACELTTLLLMFSLSLSDAVEVRWPRVMVPRALGALAHGAVRSFQSNQPAREVADQGVLDSLEAQRIGTFDQPPNLAQLDALLWPYEEAERRDAVVIDWGVLFDPETGAALDPPPPAVAARGVDVWSLIDNLQNAGALTEEHAAAARGSLGPARATRPAASGDIREASVLLTPTIANALEDADALQALIACARVVLIDQAEEARTRANVSDVARRRRNAELAGDFARHCADRLASGVYYAGGTIAGYASVGDLGMQTRALFDFLGTDVGAQGALVVDDRFASQWPHREGTPMVGIAEILDALRRCDALGEERFFAAMLTLRAQGLYFIPITSEEIVRYLSSAPVANGVVSETAELRTLRRYLARGLELLHRSDDVAARSAEENTFAFASSSNIRQALSALFASETHDIEARIAWILQNLWFDEVTAYSGLPVAMPGLRDHAVADMAAATLFMDALASNQLPATDGADGEEVDGS